MDTRTLVQNLHANNSSLVRETILQLIRDGKRYEKYLIELLKKAVREFEGEEEESESLAPLWAAVVLGEIKSKRAVSALIGIFKTDYDYFLEASSEALIKIAQKYQNLVFQQIKDFIEWELGFNDPHRSGRIYAYGVLETMVGNSEVEKFLLEKFEEDELNWVFAIGLAKFGNKNFLEMLKRQLEIAYLREDCVAIPEFKEAYRLLDGKNPSPYLFKGKEFWEEPWQERWKSKLEELDLTKEEQEAREKEIIQRLEKKERSIEADEELRKIIEDGRITANYPIASFNLENYLKIRPRRKFEEDFQEWLKLLGLSKSYLVENIQLMIDSTTLPWEILGREPFKNLIFPSEEEYKEFINSFMVLWNNTPRNEFNGLSPQERMEYS